jgi:hypothetical protein
VVALLLLIGLVALHRAGRNDNPELLDQGAYLHVSLLIHEHRGLTDGNRHPLYPALLAPFASRDHAFFPSAKIVTLVLGLAGYAFVAWRVARRWGSGMAALVLLACGSSFVWTASGLRCEVLLIPLVWAFWETGAAGFEAPRRWIVAGAAAGLCYLTKASGMLLVLAFGASWLLGGQLRDRRRWNLALFLIPLALVISPLAVWNARQYGEPFYNVNSKHVMWLDGWEQAGRVHTPLPTLQSWFAEHGMRDAVARELSGFVRLPDLWLFVLFAAAVASMVASGRNRPEAVVSRTLKPVELSLAVAVVGIHAVLLAWYTPVVSSSRFVIPIQPIMWLVVLAAAAQRLPAALMRWIGRARPALAVLLVFAVVLAPFVLDLHDPYRDDIATYPEIEDWIRSSGEASLVYGPSQNFPQWIFIPDFAFVPVPPDVTFDEMIERASRSGARYYLVDREMLRNRPQIAALVGEVPGSGLTPASGAEGFELVASDREVPTRWLLFRYTGSAPERLP